MTKVELVTATDQDVPFSILATIRSRAIRLPVGEARVAQVILEQPYSAITWSAQELAREARTSSPTVVRACRRLGFSGLPELRLALAREVGWSRLLPDTSDGGHPNALAATFADTLRVVESMGRGIDVDRFDEAVRLVAGANRVLFVCAGPTQVVCRDALFDLVSIGRPVEFVDDSVVQRMLASRLRSGDVCIAVGVSGENVLTVGAASAALEAGATLITVTSSHHSTLGRLGAVSLSVVAANALPETHSAAALVSMILLFRALTSTLAAGSPQRQAPLAQILGSPLMNSADYHRRSSTP